MRLKIEKRRQNNASSVSQRGRLANNPVIIIDTHQYLIGSYGFINCILPMFFH